MSRSVTLAICAGLLAISGCQTGPMSYERIGYGPDLEVARAQCEIGAMGVGQGMVAWGTPSYVAGAQLGNAVGNAIRQQQFLKNCMTIQGWRQVPALTPARAKEAARQAQAAGIGTAVAPAKFPGPPSAPNRAPKPAGPSGY